MAPKERAAVMRNPPTLACASFDAEVRRCRTCEQGYEQRGQNALHLRPDPNSGEPALTRTICVKRRPSARDRAAVAVTSGP